MNIQNKIREVYLYCSQKVAEYGMKGESAYDALADVCGELLGLDKFDLKQIRLFTRLRLEMTALGETWRADASRYRFYRAKDYEDKEKQPHQHDKKSEIEFTPEQEEKLLQMVFGENSEASVGYQEEQTSSETKKLSPEEVSDIIEEFARVRHENPGKNVNQIAKIIREKKAMNKKTTQRFSDWKYHFWRIVIIGTSIIFTTGGIAGILTPFKSMGTDIGHLSLQEYANIPTWGRVALLGWFLFTFFIGAKCFLMLRTSKDRLIVIITVAILVFCAFVRP